MDWVANCSLLYGKESDTALEKLFETPAMELFNQSNYKPAK